MLQITDAVRRTVTSEAFIRQYTEAIFTLCNLDLPLGAALQFLYGPLAWALMGGDPMYSMPTEEERAAVYEFVKAHFDDLKEAAYELLERNDAIVRRYPSPSCALCGEEPEGSAAWLIPKELEARFGVPKGERRVIVVRLCPSCLDEPDESWPKIKEEIIFSEMQVQ
ncbi:MAG TPA: hypothetical protein VK302_10595 [Terriglobales bacterium]|nr:hypothetical protein [Terriglobales bacterium]